MLKHMSGVWIFINLVFIVVKDDIAFEQVDVAVRPRDLFDLIFWEVNLDHPFYFRPQSSVVNNVTSIIIVI